MIVLLWVWAQRWARQRDPVIHADTWRCGRQPLLSFTLRRRRCHQQLCISEEPGSSSSFCKCCERVCRACHSVQIQRRGALSLSSRPRVACRLHCAGSSEPNAGTATDTVDSPGRLLHCHVLLSHSTLDPLAATSGAAAKLLTCWCLGALLDPARHLALTLPHVKVRECPCRPRGRRPASGARSIRCCQHEAVASIRLQVADASCTYSLL
mmetsp:Transcript_56795/g.132381  ORF Transcript_56795/g.132381 Transcript_56795/m.132381 type:complete len:210 (+) Transcript_56795:234-863(+)